MSMTDTGSGDAAPADTSFAGETNEDFDRNLQDFLSSDFGLSLADDGGATESASEGNDTIQSGSGNDSISAGSGNDTISGQDSAAGAASNGDLGGGAASTDGNDAIDPAVLAEIMGFAGPSSTTAEPTADGTGQGQDNKDEPQDFMPFRETFRLPPQMTAALFESEDTETREKALVGLLTGFGNTITKIVTDHVRSELIPQGINGYAAAQNQGHAAKLIHDDFYGSYPELAAVKGGVMKAFEVVRKQHPEAGYTPETKALIARYAKAAAQAAGIQLGTPAKKEAPASPPSPAKKPAANSTGGAFEAGGARPSGVTTSGETGPATLFEELRDFG